MALSLVQDGSNLIGSRESIEALSAAKSARILVASDSHGNAAALAYALEKFGAGSSALVFCGDGVRDLAYLLQKALCDEYFFCCIPPVVAFVRGNNDGSTCGFAGRKNPGQTGQLRQAEEPGLSGECGEPDLIQMRVPLKSELCAAGHKAVLVHGHAYNLYGGLSALAEEAEQCGADILFFGHTHIPASGAVWGKKRAPLILNPGSCALPRAGQPPSFAVVDLKNGSPEVQCTFYKIQYPTPSPFTPPPLFSS